MKHFCRIHAQESNYGCPHCEADQYKVERDVLRKRVMDLEKENWDLEMTTDAANCLADGAIELARERDELETEVNQLHTKIRDLSTPDVWIWLGDGSDDLDSMCDSMTIKIRAEDLRALLERPEISGVF